MSTIGQLNTRESPIILQPSRPQISSNQNQTQQKFNNITQNVSNKVNEINQKISNTWNTNKKGFIIGIIIVLIVIIILSISIPLGLKAESYSVVTDSGKVISQDLTNKNNKFIEQTSYGDFKTSEQVSVMGYLQDQQPPTLLNSMTVPQNKIPTDEQELIHYNLQGDGRNIDQVTQAQNQGIDNINAQLKEQQHIKNVEGYSGISQTALNNNYSMEPNTLGDSQMLSNFNYINNQTVDTQIQKETNLNNTQLMQDINQIRQQMSQQLQPLQDINQIEQLNREAQRIQDEQNLTSQTKDSDIMQTPYNPNASVQARTQYIQNTNRPFTVAKNEAPIVPIGPNMPTTNNIDIIKDAVIKQNNTSSISTVPNMKSTENNQQLTSITKEPKVQTSSNKIIISQEEIPNGKGKVELVETTIIPDAVAQVAPQLVEEYIKMSSNTMRTLSKTQRKALGAFMTLQVLYSFSGVPIPNINNLITKFPQIKPIFSFSQSYINSKYGLTNKKQYTKDLLERNYTNIDNKLFDGWITKSINETNLGKEYISQVVAAYKNTYGIDPIQKSVTGEIIKTDNGNLINKVDKKVVLNGLSTVRDVDINQAKQQQAVAITPLQKASSVSANNGTIEKYKSLQKIGNSIKVVEVHKQINPNTHKQTQKLVEKFYKI